jgi:hypothetical protein
VYKDRFIAYSLGNFCTFRGIKREWHQWTSRPLLKLYTDVAGKFFYAQITPTIQNLWYVGVKIDSEKRVIKIIQDLSKKDFPESPVQIDDNGLITYLAQ